MPLALAGLLAFSFFQSSTPLHAQDGANSSDAKALSVSPADALQRFSVAPTLKVDLWASEPLLANPVALSFDERGRAYVVETYRRRTSVPDIRKNMEWLLPDLALRSVEERIAFMQKADSPEANRRPDKDHADLNKDGRFDWRDRTVEGERIKLLEDRDGDGHAETASVFADGFNRLETGVAAGVLATGGTVYFTCIPDLWRLQDATPEETGHATKRDALLTGFGVHVAYGGHDMHGIKMGPDGRIYWSIADCGAHVTTKEGKTIHAEDMGAVYRANPDGSNLELYAWGLRNPQSLAFNDLGDLFTGDNNADGGDKARWEHIVEGADYGWRIGWQFLPKLGAWNSERLWELDLAKTALSSLPPVGHVGHGPAGIAWYPGTGLPENFRGHFFMADFPGGVRAFTIQPRGASYTLENPGEILLNNKQEELRQKVLWGLSPSDVQFGVDGGVYVLDWIAGWEKTGKGRIFRVHDQATDASDEVQKTKQLLAEGMTQRPDAELLSLLGYVDQRVRQAAQFTLARKGEAAISLLATAAAKNEQPLARLHAIWGLGQIARKSPRAAQPLMALLRDNTGEVRAQAAKVLADSVQPAPVESLIPLLRDPEPRVRFFAAQTLGHLKAAESIPALLSLAQENADNDPYVRHSVVVALASVGDVAALTTEVRNKSDAVRTAVLLALRRLHRPEVAVFLSDWNQQLMLEAARAIHDEPIDGALLELASAPITNLGIPFARRVINANYRLGNPAAAQILSQIATEPSPNLQVRLDAIEALTQWNEPLGRDRLLGTWRELPAGRDPKASSSVVAGIAPRLLEDPAREIQLATLSWISSTKPKSLAPSLEAAVRNPKVDPTVRARALRALNELAASNFPATLDFALHAPEPALAAEGRRLAAQASPEAARTQIFTALDGGSTSEKQAAFQSLALLNDKEAVNVLGQWLDRLTSGKVPSQLQLDLLESAAQSADETIKLKLATYEKKRNASDPLAPWRECLEGGDAQVGRQVFYEKAEAACLRCHKVKGEGGDVGPDLAGVATRHDRAYLLESIVAPNAQIAPGFETVFLTLNDGTPVVGIASAETDDEFTITPLTGGEKIKVKKASVAKRDKVPSAMPEGLPIVLGKRDLRNVVEFLSTLR